MKEKIYITYKEGILDPEGTTISKALDSMGINGIKNLSVGKCIEMELSSNNYDDAQVTIEQSCKKLLANPNTEIYHYEILDD